MSRFTYLIAEGVLDVIFLNKVICQAFGFRQIQKHADLPDHAKEWLSKISKWPIADDITRMSVPAPVFLNNQSSLIGIRNAKGIKNVDATVRGDYETFLRLDWFPDTMCVILDADDQTPAERFADFVPLFQVQERGLPQPSLLGQVAANEAKRSGVFSFPGTGQQGTIEDVLLPIAKTRFGNLSVHAARYVAEWMPSESVDFKELAKPSGRKKAQLSAMTALLKPGKSINASIDDQNWISNSVEIPELVPLIKFLADALLEIGDP